MFDSTNGFHARRDRPPWELKVPEKPAQPLLPSTTTFDGNTDYLVKEKQSQVQYGDMIAPEEVTSRKVAPIDLWSGGTYQAGNPLMMKMEALRTREGLPSNAANDVLEIKGREGPIVLDRNPV